MRRPPWSRPPPPRRASSNRTREPLRHPASAPLLRWSARAPSPRSVKAATYVIGLGLVAGYLAPRGFLATQGDLAASLAFLLEHEALLYVWYLVLYLVGGTALVVLSLALHEHLRDAAGTLLVRTATAFGLVWAGLLLAAGLVALVGQRAVVALAGDDPGMATATWSSVTVVQDALGGGIEVVGALWVLLVSLIGLRSARWGRGLSGLGIGLGACGVLTLVPPGWALRQRRSASASSSGSSGRP